MKCGRCAGSFLVEAIDNAAAAAAGAGAGSAGGGGGGGSPNPHLLLPYVIAPSKEVLENVHFEEWFCPFCLSEDSSRGVGLSARASARESAGASARVSARASARESVRDGGDMTLVDSVSYRSPSIPPTSSIFFSDEWGSSAALPWLLHPGLSTLADKIVER